MVKRLPIIAVTLALLALSATIGVLQVKNNALRLKNKALTTSYDRVLGLASVDHQSPFAPYGPKALEWFAVAPRNACDDFRKSGTAVLVVSGQSNASNSVQTREPNQYGSRIQNYFANNCFEAKDPLMGADGDLGSPWIRLANELIRSGKYERVLIAPIALGGSSITRWRAGADMHASMANMLTELSLKKVPVTHFLWTQGEADREVDSRYRMNGGADYLEALQSIVDTVHHRSNAMVYVALASRCWDTPNPAKEIRWAQTQIASQPGVYQGPDLDALWESGDRYDRCHFSDAGAKKLTGAWMAALYPKSVF